MFNILAFKVTRTKLDVLLEQRDSPWIHDLMKKSRPMIIKPRVLELRYLM